MDKGYKRVPSFWWDFSRDGDEIVVESDSDKYPVCARYWFLGEEGADKAIAKAEALIADFKAGRKTPVACE